MSTSLKSLTIVFMDYGLASKELLDSIAKLYGMHVLETGVLIRELLHTNSPIANNMKQYIEAGKLVPTKLVNEFLGNQIYRAKGPILLSGYPRSVDHYHALIKLLKQQKIPLQGIWYFQLADSERYRQDFYKDSEHAGWFEKYGDEILETWQRRYDTYSKNLSVLLEVIPPEELEIIKMEYRSKKDLESYVKLRLKTVKL